MPDEPASPPTDGAAAAPEEEAPAQAPPAGSPPPLTGAKWAEPIMVADQAWTRFEVWLALVAFLLEAVSMTVWVCLKGFSAPADHASSVVFRAIIGSTILGSTAHWALRKQTPEMRRRGTLAAVFLGILTAKLWVKFGGDYCSNLLNWYQQASFLTLLGGLRGVGTRLTMLLALVGGSLATARGRHIVIDIVTRFVSHQRRTLMVLTGWVFAAIVCVTAAWGFFDHISIENFGARADDSAGKKIGQVMHQLGEDFFVARKQIALDFKSTPHVLFKGETYSEWLTGKEWNAWIEDAGFAERYGKEAVEGLKIPDGDTRAPLIVIPGRGEPRGELINAAYLVFPIGLLVIAMRFIVRGLLVLSGWVSVDTDESEDWAESEHRQATPGEV
jgi:TRAP-type C4-dicarboxylate transport system permease small subunit